MARTKTPSRPFLGLLTGEEPVIANVVLALPAGSRAFPGRRWKLAWIAEGRDPAPFMFDRGGLTRLADFGVALQAFPDRSMIARRDVAFAAIAKHADGTPWPWSAATTTVTVREECWDRVRAIVRAYTDAQVRTPAAIELRDYLLRSIIEPGAPSALPPHLDRTPALREADCLEAAQPPKPGHSQ